jgi:hypothetical protein
VNSRKAIEGSIPLIIGSASILEGFRLTLYKIPGVLYDRTGPGIFGILVGVGLLAIGVVHIARDEKGPATTAGLSVMNRKVLGIIGVCIMYVLLIYLAGYPLASLAFFVLTCRISGVSSWRSSLVIAASLTIIYFTIFVTFCNLMFPQGLIFK